MRISDWSSDVCSSDLLDRAYEPQHVIPLLTNNVGTDAFAQQRRDEGIGCCRGNRREAPVGKIAQARAEAKSQHGAKGEDMIGGPAGVSIMLGDFEKIGRAQV